VSDETDFTHDAYIDFADNRLDAQSGTMLLRAVMPNPNGFLTPGLFGRVQIASGRPYEALLVPDVAIQSDQTRKVVMTVNAENTVVPKPVELGEMHGTLRVIQSGLTADDKVVVNGLMRARPGSKVTPQVVDLTKPENGARPEQDAALPTSAHTSAK
jgi:RND family efflux transporter MFP subunit